MAVAELKKGHDQYRRDRLERNREITREGQEIGPLPKVQNKRRRNRAVKDFHFFATKYFPDISTKPWADHHHIAAEKMERCAKDGGLFAFALPRGSLKTTLCRFMLLWLALTGRSIYSILIGASERAAEKRLSGIKKILATNNLLLEDFPEVCYPIRKMDRSTRRCTGQILNGQHTAMEWLSRHIVLPTVEGSVASGARIECYGITGEIRGTDHTMECGKLVRPQIVFADDPQTRESAKSPAQSEHRERVLVGDVAYLNGPTSAMSIVMPCTVIYEGDLAHRMLDRQRNPQWRGETHKMMDSMPTNTKLWDKYESILNDCHEEDADFSKATKFYKKNQKEMDKGGRPTWKHRYVEGEISAIQHAMNLYFRDREAFFAEGQNDPLKDEASLALRSQKELSQLYSGFARETFPEHCQHVTAFIDIQGELLYYVVAAWTRDFTGFVIDYGTWPEQRRRYFTLRDARQTLSKSYKGKDTSGRIFKGLEDLCDHLLDRPWVRDDGAELHISRLLIDNGWHESNTAVRHFCRVSKYAAVVLPSHGRGIKVSQMPMHEWATWRKMRNPGADNWVITRPEKSNILTVLIDTNYWKKRVHEGLCLDRGDAGSITLYDSRSPNHHRMIADHLLAERPVKTVGNGRTVYEWNLKPGQDNHLFDCMVGSAVAASICGATPTYGETKAQKPQARRKRKRVKYFD